MQTNRNFGPFMGKIKKLTETVPEEVQILDLLDGGFKSIVLIVL